MKNILLICSAGMSTSLIVKRMEEAAKAIGFEAKIWAVANGDMDDNLPKADVVLLGPQVRFLKDTVEKKVAGQKPVAIMNMADYGSMNGKKILDSAIALL